MKLSLSILALLLSVICMGQKPADLSDRLDFDNTGTYKLLQMSNGNTLLFHFIITGQVAVSVFSKTHSLLRTADYDCKLLNPGSQSPPLFRGLYEINGEAVLFAERTSEQSHALLRLRFDAKNGKCMDEVVAITPDTSSVATSYYVLKNRNSAYYNVFCYRDVVNSASGAGCELLRYNSQHVLMASTPLHLAVDSVKKMRLLSADIGDNGAIYVAFGMHGTAQSDGKAGKKHQYYDRKLLIAEIKRGEKDFSITKINLERGTFPNYNEGFPFIADFYCDTASGKYTYLVLDTRFPENLFFYPLLLTVYNTSRQIKMIPIGDPVAVRENNSKKSYYGIPMKLFVKGDTTLVISENFLEHKLGEIRMNSFDTGGMIVQTAHMRRNLTTHDVYPDDVLWNRATKTSFQNNYADFYNTNFVNTHGNTYVFFNENPKSILTIPSGSKNNKTAYTFTWRLGNDWSARRMSPFGKPSVSEYLTALMGSADYDPATNCYAILVHENSWYKNFYRVAWWVLK